MTWRFFATRLDGSGGETQVIPDIPVTGPVITDALSAPDQMQAKVAPEILGMRGPDGLPVLRPWETALYAESDGVIRHGSIVTGLSTSDDGSVLTVESAGFASYPAGQPWTGTTRLLYDRDPADVIRLIWEHLQSAPRGDLGVRLNATATRARVGRRVPEVRSVSGEVTVQAVDEPVVLAAYATHDLGALIDELCEAGSIDWRESHAWAPDGTISHRIDLHYPRAGTRRHDLLFDVGVNCLAVPDVDIRSGDYASEVLLLGAGEGDKMVRAHAYVPGADRLRRVVVERAKHVGRSDTARTVAAGRARARNRHDVDVSELRVYDHPLAPLHSWQAGDEVRVTGDAGWAGTLDQWVRVMATAYTPGDQAAGAVLTVSRADRT